MLRGVAGLNGRQVVKALFGPYAQQRGGVTCRNAAAHA